MDSSKHGVEAARDQEVNRSANRRSSRWSDGPPSSGSNLSSAAVEPPSKKPRNDLPAQVDAPSKGDPSSLTSGPVISNPSCVMASVVASAPNFTCSGAKTYAAGYSGHSTSGPVSFAPGSAKSNGVLFYKTKLCNNFKNGACSFNERCHFAHGVEELRKMPTPSEAATAGTVGGRSSGPGTGVQPRKVKMCRFFLEGNCPYGERCNFLHGNEQPQGLDVSSTVKRTASSWPSYKSQMCAKWERGEVCEYGEKCYYAHGHEELQHYSGAVAYSNSGTTVSNVQPTSFTPVMNTLPVVTPYTAPVNYQHTVNVSYPNAGTSVPTCPGTQQGPNGTTSYGYWGATATSIQPVVPSQGYAEPHPWMTGYPGNGVRGADGKLSQYPQAQAQVQPQQQQSLSCVDTTTQYSQQTQTAFYVPAGGYQNVSYAQGEVKSGEGVCYQVPSNYSSQQANYGPGYPVA